MNKRIAIGVVVVAVALIVILAMTAFSGDKSTNDDGGSTQLPGTTSGSGQDSQSTGSSSSTGTGSVKEFTMTAKNWEFDPGTITVNQGDTVKLAITSVDVNHGIALPDFGVNQKLNPGETVNVEFVADKKGTFSFFCNVFCGEGHRGMKGSLIVQ